jgi:hypothetical protein
MAETANQTEIENSHIALQEFAITSLAPISKTLNGTVVISNWQFPIDGARAPTRPGVGQGDSPLGGPEGLRQLEIGNWKLEMGNWIPRRP